MIFLGQAFTQVPQAVQLSSITTGNPVIGSIYIASNLHVATQSPSPKQPYAQPPSPAKRKLAKPQLSIPS